MVRARGVGRFGGLGEVLRVLLDPYRALFPIKVLYGTQSGSKRYIMVQMANFYKVCINDPFLDL